MAQPPQFNYSIDVGSPFISALKGYELGMGIETKRQQMLGQQQLAQQQMLRQQEIDMALEKVRGPNPTAEDYRRLEILLPPDQAKSIRESLAQRTDVQNQQALRSSGRIFAAFRAGRPDIAIDFIDQEIATQRNAGNEAGAKSLETWRDVAKNSEEGVKQTQDFFGFVISEIPGGDKIIESALKISKETREAELHPNLVAQRNAERAKAESQAEIEEINAKYAEQMAKANLNRLTREALAEGGDNVQSSKILDDGTAVIVTKSGRTRVIDTAGNELIGDARGKAIRDAEAFGAETQMRRAGGRKGAEIGQATALKAFESVGKVRQNIENLNQAISALNRGARTGAIESRFPNWRASSIELQNIQRQLGLDIIGSVTFGALSEGELNLALETALPVTMNERELRDWLQRKITAQNKLANYLSEQARFLSVPGRTINDWLERTPQGAGQPSGAAPAAAPAMSPGFRVIR
jgi:hypothetical protein